MQRFLCTRTETLESDRKDARIGLGVAGPAGHDDGLKAARETEPVTYGVQTAVKVGYDPESQAALFQCRQRRRRIGEQLPGIRLRKVIPTISSLLLRGFWWRLKEKYVIRDFHHLVFFYCMGLTLFPAGSMFGLYLFLYRVCVGTVATTSALFAAFLIISGLQALFFAMFFDMDYNKHLK